MKATKFLILIIFFVTACSQKKETIIARVNGDKLSLNDFRSHFSEERWKNLNKQEKDRFIEEWIRLSLLAQEADKRGISQKSEIQSRIKNAGKKIRSNALISSIFTDIKVSEDEMFKYFKIHQNEYKNEYKEFKLQRIFIKDSQKLRSVLDEMKNGLKFTEAAKKYSEESIGSNGGYAGFISEKDVHKNVWDELQKLKKWRYNQVEVDNGYYIVRYYDTRINSIEKNFEDVKDEIYQKLLTSKKEDKYKELLENLKLKADIIRSL